MGDRRPNGDAMGLSGRVALSTVLGGLLGRDDGISVGRYRLDARLGHGTYGVVYRALDPQLDRSIAIKILVHTHRHPEVVRARMLREAQALAQLRHPNVVAVYDIGCGPVPPRGEQSVYLVMELVRGTTLSEWIAGSRPDWRRIVEAYFDAGRALAAAHAVGVIHRDFKPSNVMRADDGAIKVLDFGLAHCGDAWSEVETLEGPVESASTRQNEVLTATGAVLGTPRYMAPEQCYGDPVDHATDQYALSVSLYEGLFGRPPYDAKSMERLAMQKQRPIPRRCPDVRVPAAVYRVLRRAMAPAPRARFASMQCLVDALERASAPRRRRKVMVAFGALAVAAVATAWMLPTTTSDGSCELPEIDETRWDQAQRDRVHGVVHAEDRYTPEMTWKRIVPRVDRHLAQWRALRADACIAMRSPVGPAPSPARMRCIRRGIENFDRTLAALGDPAQWPSSVRALWSLRAPQGCALAQPASGRDPTILEALELDRIDAELTELTLTTVEGPKRNARLFVTHALARARALEDHALVVRLLLARSDAEAGDMRLPDAAATVQQAAAHAAAAGDLQLAAEAAPRTLRYVAEMDPDEAGFEAARAEVARYVAAAGEPAGPAAELAEYTGLYYTRRGAFDRGRAAFERVDDLAARHPDEVGAFTLSKSLMSLSAIEMQEQDYAAATRSLQRSIEAAPPVAVAGREALALAKTQLSGLLYFQGRLDESGQAVLEAITLQHALYGDGVTDVTWEISWYGNILFAQGAADQGIALMTSALERAQALQGELSPQLLPMIANLVRAELARENWDAALAWSERRIAFLQAKRPDSDATWADAFADRAAAHLGRGERRAADADLAACRQRGGAGDAEYRLTLARLRLARGELADARAALEAMLDGMDDHDRTDTAATDRDPTFWRTRGTARRLLAQAVAREGRPHLARALLQGAIDDLRRTDHRGHAEVGRAEAALGSPDLGRAEAALGSPDLGRAEAALGSQPVGQGGG
jgi:tRNA A-37 threonylcarbamoyl transferase component Bud32